MSGARRTIALGLLGLLALGVRAWVVLAQPEVVGQRDSNPACRIAENLLAGRGFSLEVLGSEGPTSTEPPFYPLLLAAAYGCFGPAGPVAVQLLQCVAGAVLVLVVAWLGWSLLPDRLGFGWVAAVGAALYPPHLSLVARLQVAVWAALALGLLLALVVSTLWQGTRRKAVLAGWLAGLLLLMEPMLVLALPVCAAAFWLADGDRTWAARLARGRIARVALLVGVALLVVAPWLVRNRLVHGRFTFVTTSFGYSLWQGNNPLSGESDLHAASPPGGQPSRPGDTLAVETGAPREADRQTPDADETLLPPEGGREFLAPSEPQRSQWLLRRGFQYICEHPARYGQLCLKRLRCFLLWDDAPGSRPERIAAVAWLVLGVLGLWLSRGRWRSLWPSYAIFVAAALFPVLVSAAAGFRTAVEPMTFVWASAAVAPLLVRLVPGRRIRVYRPGEQAGGPAAGAEHVLQGPHYDVDVSVRRRAG
jgi:hypothetical protein